MSPEEVSAPKTGPSSANPSWLGLLATSIYIFQRLIRIPYIQKAPVSAPHSSFFLEGLGNFDFTDRTQDVELTHGVFEQLTLLKLINRPHIVG